MSHERTVEFVEHRVADSRILRLIRKWLTAGVSEDGAWSETEMGTPQGAVISPLLANLYLHYVGWKFGEGKWRLAMGLLSATPMILFWASSIDTMPSDSWRSFRNDW